MPKKPEGFSQFDSLMRKLAKVPSGALRKDAMRYLIVITVEGETINVWANTANEGRAAGNLLAGSEGVEKVEMFDTDKTPLKLIGDWLGTN